jgi:hypothetical protein
MLRRAQLALSLVLLLALAPLAGATCGIACLTAIPHRPMQAATAQHHCVRAAACCHSSGPAICAVTQAPEAIAAWVAANTAAVQHDASPAIVAIDFSPLSLRDLAAHSIDRSPPGQLRTSNPIPLRV